MVKIELKTVLLTSLLCFLTPLITEEFILENWAAIVQKVSVADQIADHFVEKKIIRSEQYQAIQNIKTSQEKIREFSKILLSGGNLASEIFYSCLKEHDPTVFTELEENWNKRKLDDENSQVSKKRRLDEIDSRESFLLIKKDFALYSSFSFVRFFLNFEMEMYLDNPEDRQRLINQLKQQLMEKEIEHLEKLLSEMKLKTPSMFDHSVVKSLTSCRDLEKFLEKSPEKKKFPQKLITVFFKKDCNSSGKIEHLSSQTNSPTENEVSGKSEHLSSQTNSPTSTLETSVTKEMESESILHNNVSSPQCISTEATTDCSLPNSENPANCQNDVKGSGFSEIHPYKNGIHELGYGVEDPVLVSQSLSATAPAENVYNEKILKSKRQPGQAQRKKVQEETQIITLLGNWVRQRIPADKQGTNLEKEELGKIRDGITIVNIRQYKPYPCLVCERCIVFTDPQTGEKSIIELQLKEIHCKNGTLMSDPKFKVQFNMGVLDINETILLLPDKNEEKIVCDHSFEKNVELFKKIMYKVFFPVFAFFKEVQRKKLLGGGDELQPFS
ncbi:AN1-type zinc finger protein 3 isoform X1 [Arapaima gigas]